MIERCASRVDSSAHCSAAGAIAGADRGRARERGSSDRPTSSRARRRGSTSTRCGPAQHLERHPLCGRHRPRHPNGRHTREQRVVGFVARQLVECSPELLGDHREGLALRSLSRGIDRGHCIGMDEGLRSVEHVECVDQSLEAVTARRTRSAPGCQSDAVAEPAGQCEDVACAPVAELGNRLVECPFDVGEVGGNVLTTEQLVGQCSAVRRTSRRAPCVGASASRPCPCWRAPRATRRTR